MKRFIRDVILFVVLTVLIVIFLSWIWTITDENYPSEDPHWIWIWEEL